MMLGKQVSKATNAHNESPYLDPLKELNEPFDLMFQAEVEQWVSRLPKYCQKCKGSAKELMSPKHPDPRNNLVGLAMSGGGMRSATFNLGALQALGEGDLLRHIDYMGTISGGGYLGASITSLCAEELPYQTEHSSACHGAKLGMAKQDFPFGFPGPMNSGISWGNSSSTVHGLESPATRHVREYSRLIIPSPGLFDPETWTGVSRYVLSTILLWALFLLTPLTVICLLTAWIPTDIWSRSAPFTSETWLANNWWVMTFPLWLLAGVGILSLLRELKGEQGRGDKVYRDKLWQIQRIGLILMGISIAALALVPALWGYGVIVENVENWILTLAAGGAAGINLGAVRKLLSLPAGLGRVLWSLIFGISGYAILGMGIIGWYYFLWNGWELLGWGAFQEMSLLELSLGWISVGITVGLTWIWGQTILNHLSLNTLYEQRLRRTWLIAAIPRNGGLEMGSGKEPANWSRVWVRKDLKVGDLATPETRSSWRPKAPYHLICAAINMPGSTGPQNLNRKAESFVIGPIYSGSANTRWRPTRRQTELWELSLARAASISAAAVSPNMGGYTSPTLSIVTTLFNVRLGWWIKNPRWYEPDQRGRLRWKRWSFWSPTFLYWKEMFGKASDKDPFVYLSDGGHFENLGIYELLRRRCRYIIAIDGTGESAEAAPLTFQGLGMPLRRARIDFGVIVDIDLRPMMRDPKTGLVRSHFAVGRIKYPRQDGYGKSSSDEDNHNGFIVFIKAGKVAEATPPDIISYSHAVNREFPHDATSDQQFDEPQFESYRMLGAQAGQKVCQLGGDNSDVEQWFRNLDAKYQCLLKELGYS